MKSKKVEKQVRKQYSREFKKEALLRAERDGAAAAAKDLGLNVSQLYSWRAKDRASGQVSEAAPGAVRERSPEARVGAARRRKRVSKKSGGVLREDPK
jgi:transposase